MSEAKQNEGSVYFIDVPKVGKPVPNNTLVVSQKLAQRDSVGNITSGESTVMVGSDGQGLYTITKSDQHRDAKIKALKAKMARENTGKYPVIVGPFDSPIEAFKDMHAKREKSDAETAAILTTETGTLREESSAKDTVIGDLKAKLAAAMSKGKQ